MREKNLVQIVEFVKNVKERFAQNISTQNQYAQQMLKEFKGSNQVKKR